MEIIIDPMKPEDWEQVRTIYWEGIATGNATFEARPAEWGKWDSSHVIEPRLVAKNDREIVAWASLSRVSAREVYAGVAEVSIYVAAKYRGQGIGSDLLRFLIDRSEKKGFWTLQAGIFPENKESIELHKRYGFRVLGVREKVGKMDFGKLQGKWRDVVLMERRSKTVGID